MSEFSGNFVNLDIDLLRGLEELSPPGTDNLLVELAELFEKTTPQLLSDLRSAITSAQIETVVRIAHRLKGSAANIGAQGMANLCSHLEKSATRSSAEINSKCADEIVNSFLVSSQEIRNWINHLKQ
jgi:HPt (histidine-containing phosphotransfer) domain-containing protein